MCGNPGRWFVREKQLTDDLVVGAALLAGGANVIMQLSHPAVGHGVIESTVDSGNLFRHPIKRTRTTITYLAVAMLGTEEERHAYRQAVSRSHIPVRSGATSPVSYNAFDPNLQLWVAACLYKGFEDVDTAFHLTGTEQRKNEFYQFAARLGTTLQMRPEMWPDSREQFARYWEDQLSQMSIDDAVRAHLDDVADLRFLPRPVSAALGPFHRFITTGFLPQRLRDEMRMSWTARDQRRFNWLMAGVGAVTRALPTPLRQFPLNLALWDLRRRRRAGRPLV